MSAVLPASAPIQTSPRWIVSPWFDTLVFAGSALAVWFPYLSRHVWSLDVSIIIAVVAIVSNGPHLAATWTRVYLDARERRERPWSYIGVPVLIAVGVVATGTWAPYGFRLVITGLIGWAIWHFAAQCYGLLRIYQKKSGEAPRFAHRLEGWLVFAFGWSGLLWRLAYGRTWVFGRKVLFPTPPDWLVWGVMAFVAGLVIALVVDRLRPGIRAGWPRIAFLASVAMGFWVPFMLIRNGTAAFAAAAAWHGLQYIGIVWLYNLRRFGGRPIEPGARIVGWVSQPGRGWAYMLLLWGLAGVVYGFVELTAVATKAVFADVAVFTWTSLTLGHYWIDGLIWKMRRPQVSANLTG